MSPLVFMGFVTEKACTMKAIYTLKVIHKVFPKAPEAISWFLPLTISFQLRALKQMMVVLLRISMFCGMSDGIIYCVGEKSLKVQHMKRLSDDKKLIKVS